MSEKLKKETFGILFLSGVSELAHSFLYVTYTVFLISRGVSLSEVSLLCMICGIASVVFDIPTGAFADVIGRKKAYLASCIVWIMACIFYVVSNNFWGYALAEILAALAMAFSSGCLSAHMWDTVAMIGNEMGCDQAEIDSHNKALSAKVIWVTSPISALGGFLGAKLLEINPGIPWIATAAGMIVAIVTASIVLSETKTRKRISFTKDIKEMTENTLLAFKILFSEKRLGTLAVMRASLRIATVPIFLYWSAYLKESGASLGLLGVAWILMEVAMSLGVFLSRKAPRAFNEQRQIAVFAMVIGVSAIIASFASSYTYVLLGILVIEAANMALGYVLSNVTQKEIGELGFGEAGSEKNMRATILSAVSTTITFGGIVGEFSASRAVKSLHIQGSWLLAGCLMLILGVVIALWVRRVENKIPVQIEGVA